MSPSGLHSTRLEVDRVISTFSFVLASSRAHRIPIEGESIGRWVKERRNATSDLVMSDGTRFHSNTPVSELIKHVTPAIEANDVASTPLVVETTDGAIVTKQADP